MKKWKRNVVGSVIGVVVFVVISYARCFYRYDYPQQVALGSGVTPMKLSEVDGHSEGIGRVGEISLVRAIGTSYIFYTARPYSRNEKTQLFMCYENIRDGYFIFRCCIPIHDVVPNEIEHGAKVDCVVEGSSIRIVRGQVELFEVASIVASRGESNK